MRLWGKQSLRVGVGVLLPSLRLTLVYVDTWFRANQSQTARQCGGWAEYGGLAVSHKLVPLS